MEFKSKNSAAIKKLFGEIEEERMERDGMIRWAFYVVGS